MTLPQKSEAFFEAYSLKPEMKDCGCGFSDCMKPTRTYPITLELLFSVARENGLQHEIVSRKRLIL